MDRGISSGTSEIYRSDPETELQGGRVRRSRENDQNVANLGQICENLSRWGLAALTLPLQKHTGVCRYVNEERSAGKSQKKIEM